MGHMSKQIKKYNVKKPRLELTLNFPSVQCKHFYYARDDIFYLLKSNPIERDFLLQALYSIVISLQNNLSINFFDMWIYEIYINKVSAKNKFMSQTSQNLETDEYITIKLAYGRNGGFQEK